MYMQFLVFNVTVVMRRFSGGRCGIWDDEVSLLLSLRIEWTLGMAGSDNLPLAKSFPFFFPTTEQLLFPLRLSIIIASTSSSWTREAFNWAKCSHSNNDLSHNILDHEMINFNYYRHLHSSIVVDTDKATNVHNWAL